MNPEKRKRRAKAKARENRIERAIPLKAVKRLLAGGYAVTEKGRRAGL